jgi:F0F1-type ATP synthase membrane subunit b/b'
MSNKVLLFCGRVLLAVFVVTVIADLFPLNLGAPGWGLRLSTQIVNAASLPLVGLLLMRYAAHLNIELANGRHLQCQERVASDSVSEVEEEPFDPIKEDMENMRLAQIAYPLEAVRKLSFAIFISLILLVVFQMFALDAGLNAIDSQSLEFTRRIDADLQGIEEQIKVAPQEAIAKAWIQSKSIGNLGHSTANPSPAAQRDEIIENARQQEKRAHQNLQAKISTAKYILIRDVTRVVVIAILYACGFYAIAKV